MRKTLFKVRNVTEGVPWKKIVSLAIPLLIGNIVQQLYNTVDTIVVGRFIGDNALSAVGAANPITNMLFILFTGIATGAGILVSQRFGAKDRDGLSKVIGNVFFLALIASLVTAVIGVILARVPLFGGKTLLTVLNTPEGDIYEWSQIYLTVIFAGVIGTVFYNLTAGILRGMGDSVTALIFLILTCTLNIGLDIWFVAGLGLGVFGVAIATVISQIISAALCVIKLFNMKDVFSLDKAALKPDREVSRGILALGLPSGISQGLFALSNVLVQSLTNSMGPVAMACSVVVLRIDAFAMMPSFSIGNAMTTYTGQNYGAKKYDRLTTGAKQCIILAFCISAVLTGTLLLLGRQLAGIFTKTDDLIELAVQMFRIMGVGYLIYGVNMTMQSFVRGVGDTKTPMWSSIISQICIRLPLAYIIAHFNATEAFPNGHPTALYYSLVISWVAATLLSLVFYLKRRRILSAEEKEYRQLQAQ